MIYKGMLIFINEMVREINDLLERFFYKLWTVAVNLSIILYANDFFGLWKEISQGRNVAKT